MRMRLGLRSLRQFADAVAVTLDAPILTQTSTVGTNPLTWSGTYNNSIIYDGAGNGDKVRMRFRLNGGAWTTEVDQPLDSATLLSGTYSWPLYNATTFSAGGLVEAQEQKARFVGGVETLTSAWSTILGDTIASAGSVAALSTTNGVNKSTQLTVSGGPPALTFAASSGTSNNCARTQVQQASAKAQFEVTMNSGGTSANFVVGLDNGTTNLGSNIAPGYSNAAGIAVNIALGAYVVVNWNSSGSQFNFANNVAGTVQNGDTFTFEFDFTNHTMDCWRTRSGALVKIGGQATGLPTLSAYYGFAGTINTAVNGTMNYGATTYVKTPGAGVAAFWG